MYNKIKIKFLNREIIIKENILFNDLIELLKSNYVKCYRIEESSNSFGEYIFIECHLNSFYHKQIFLSESYNDKWIQTKEKDDIYCKKELVFYGMGYHFNKDIYHLFNELKVNDSYSLKIVRDYLESRYVLQKISELRKYYLDLGKKHNAKVSGEQKQHNTIYDELVAIGDEDFIHTELEDNPNLINDIISNKTDKDSDNN